MSLPRRSGILLHVTSLPSGPFSGDLGPSAYAFADFLAESAQAWWQTLPLNPIGSGYSPYSSLSSFACEPMLISPQQLVHDGLVSPDALAGVPLGSTYGKSSFEHSEALRSKLLHDAHESFERNPPHATQEEFTEYRGRQSHWLDDYCLFVALTRRFGNRAWSRWPSDIAHRDAASLDAARRDLAHETNGLAFEQFLFDRQWHALKRYCADKGVQLIGDMPMFVPHDSVDVWAQPELFLLDPRGEPTHVAGAPPDAFNADGQRWGNALYDWTAHEQSGFNWWTRRVRRQLDLFDVLRLDHFIGCRRYWRIPAENATAEGGEWIEAPGESFFDTLIGALGELPVIAEDLGAATAEVFALRDRYGYPGMKVLQFGFGDDVGSTIHLPHQYPRNSVAFTGTHDNDTTRGWYDTLATRALEDASAYATLRTVHSYLGTDQSSEIATAAVRTVSSSVADTAIFPLQDILSLDGRHRMNAPGTVGDNWLWRLNEGSLGGNVSSALRALTEATDRSITDAI